MLGDLITRPRFQGDEEPRRSPGLYCSPVHSSSPLLRPARQSPLTASSATFVPTTASPLPYPRNGSAEKSSAMGSSCPCPAAHAPSTAFCRQGREANGPALPQPLHRLGWEPHGGAPIPRR